MLSSPLRTLFGNSNRTGHLRMSMALTVVIITLGLAWGNPWFWVAGLGCWVQEQWATADRDLEENRRRKSWYWLPFGALVSHRSWISHGFVWGTIIRLIYGLWPVLLGLWVIHPYAALSWSLGAFVNDLGHLALDA